MWKLVLIIPAYCNNDAYYNNIIIKPLPIYALLQSNILQGIDTPENGGQVFFFFFGFSFSTHLQKPCR